MNRKEMIESLHGKLKEWDAQLDTLEGELAAKKGEAAARVRSKRAQLEERRSRLKARLESAEKSADEGWERTSRELQAAWDEFQKAAKGVYESVSG
jgi:chromosome segregation ATPase